MLTKNTVDEFLEQVASNSPAPGGGSVSALAGALGAALTSMVARLTIGKKKYAEVQSEMEEVLKRSEDLRNQLTLVIDEDTLAFNKVMEAFGMPKETDEQKAQRTLAIEEASRSATEVPLKLIELCDRMLDFVIIVSEKGNKNSASDAGVSAIFLRAAAHGAALNVRINVAGMEQNQFGEGAKRTMDSLLKRIEEKSERALVSVNSRM